MATWFSSILRILRVLFPFYFVYPSMVLKYIKRLNIDLNKYRIAQNLFFSKKKKKNKEKNIPPTDHSNSIQREVSLTEKVITQSQNGMDSLISLCLCLVECWPSVVDLWFNMRNAEISIFQREECDTVCLQNSAHTCIPQIGHIPVIDLL